MSNVSHDTLAGKTFRLFFCLSLAVACVVAAVVTTASYLAYESDAEDRLLKQVSECVDVLQSQQGEGDPVAVLSSLALADTRVTLIADDGTVLYDSHADASTMGNHADREEVLRAKEGGRACLMRSSETMGTDTVYAAALVQDGTVIRLAENRTSLASFFGEMAMPLAFAMIIALALSLAVSRWITSAIVGPLHDIDLSRPLENKAYSELQPLLQSVEEQRVALERSVDMRREFTANVSHEMKTPLQVIGGYAELMESGMVAQDDVPAFSGIIRRESESMRALIDDVLVLSRLEERASADEQVSLAEACQRVVNRLAPAGESKGLSICCQADANAVVLGNALTVDQMVYNLVDNAIKFSPTGGVVEVAVSAGEGAAKLVVSDDGPGIPDEYKVRVFERFFRVDSSRSRETGGTGLGLAIVKHAAESMGGKVCVEDAPSGGARFVVSIPLY